MYQSDIRHPDQNLEEKLHRLYSLNRGSKINLSFRPPYLNLLQKFGTPHLKLPPIIHVAGTNGKGSTIAILRSILETAGYKVHSYTSPHLIRFNERIVLAGQTIDDKQLESLIDQALDLNGEADLTFFEITTAIAFAAFAKTPADICLLEVGMGGRLDCTNVIENPLLTIISAIGHDHAEYLGETINQIAEEKAGIIKEGAPCVIAAQTQEALENEVLNIFEAKAASIKTNIHNAETQNIHPELALTGEHQQKNLATALKALDLISTQFTINENDIKTGIRNVRWPARLQKLDHTNFGLHNDDEIYLDGGHNKDAGHVIAQQIKTWKDQDEKPVSIILGMMSGKDAQEYLKPILPLIDNFYLTNIENEPKSQKAEDLHALFPQGTPCENYREAIKLIQKNTSPSRVLICGSLYLAGHVLKDIEK